MFKTSFSGHNKIWWGPKKLGGTVPECPPWLRTWFVGRRCGSTRMEYIAL